MLAVNSYEQNEGFSVIGADELFFINGGSGAPSGGSTTSNGSSMAVTIGNGMATVGQSIQNGATFVSTVFPNNPATGGYVAITTGIGMGMEYAGNVISTNASSGSSSGSGGGGSK